MTIVAVTGPLVFPYVVGGVSQESGRGNGLTSKQGDENIWFPPQIVARFHGLKFGGGDCSFQMVSFHHEC